MPLTNEEKADIAMGDKICNEKISEEASSRIKKDLIIDSKINKLQEQINNLSKSKNEDKKQETATTDNKKNVMIEENTKNLEILGKDLCNTHYLALRPLFTEEKDDFLKNSNNKSCVNIIWESFSLNNESYNDTIIEKARIIFQGKTNGLRFKKDTAIALKEKTYFNTGTTTTTPEILWSVDVQTDDDEVLKDLKFVNIKYKDTKWRELSFLDKDMNEVIDKMYYFVSSKYSQKHKDFMNANKLEKTVTDSKGETSTIDNEQEAMIKENTNKLDTLGKDLGNTHYLALRPLFTEEKDDFLKNSNNKSCVNITWESFSLNNESYNDTIIEKARIIFQGKTNGLRFKKDTAIALKEKTYFNTGTTTTTPEILWSVDVQTDDDEVLKDLKFVNIKYKDTKWRELSFLDKDMNEVIDKMYYFVSSKYSQKHKDFMNANKL